MGTLNICLHKEVDKKYTGSLKTRELLDFALIGVYPLIRWNTGMYNKTPFACHS